MAGIQDIVYALEVGNLRQWLIRIGVLALLAGLGIFYFVKQFNGLTHLESMDTAQLSRQIATGQGYTTKFLRPIQLKKMPSAATDLQGVPDVVNAPVFPYIGAALFKASGVGFNVDFSQLRGFSVFAPERLLVLFNIGVTMLSIIVLYLWMLRAFDSRVALTAAMLFALTDLVWSTAIWGLSTPLVTLGICVIGFLTNEALISEENDELGLAMFWFLLASVVVGVVVLTNYSLLVLWPCLIGLGLLAFYRQVSMAAVAIIVPLFIVGPWLYRNFELTGHPFGLSWIEIFVDNGTHPGNSLWRTYDLEQSIGGLKPLLRAIALGSSHLLEHIGSFMGGIVPVALAVAGCFHFFRRHRSQASRWFWVAAFLLLLVFNGALIKERSPVDFPGLNLIFTLLPVFCGFGAAFAYVLFDRMKLPSMILVYPLVAILCLVQAAPMGLRIVQRNVAPFAYPPYFPPILFLVKDWIKPDEIMCSDIPWATAWYSDRTTLWLPKKRAEFLTLNDFKIKIVAMLLTPESQGGRLYQDIENGPYADWASVITRREFKDLPLPSITVLPPNKDDYLFMADRPRWK